MKLKIKKTKKKKNNKLSIHKRTLNFVYFIFCLFVCWNFLRYLTEYEWDDAIARIGQGHEYIILTEQDGDEIENVSKTFKIFIYRNKKVFLCLFAFHSHAI
jgi:hypothetical protein